MPEALPGPPSPGSTLVGTRLLEEWIQAQTVGATASCALVSQACEVRGHQLVMQWRGKNAKRPAPRHWPVLLRVCGIDPAAWETWEKLGHDEPAPPESGPRTIDLPELTGSPAERLRTLEGWLEARTRDGVGLSLDLSRAVSGMRDSIREQRAQKPIPDLHEHPDWPPALALILGAVAKHPGAARSIIDAIRDAVADEKAKAA
jgi:hypothetical protein